MKRAADVARTYMMKTETVNRLKIATASTITGSSNDFERRLSARFLEKGLWTVALGSGQDCTSEMLNLPMLGLENQPRLTRSSWHVMVGNVRVYWIDGDVDIEGENVDVNMFVRPRAPVPIVSTETGECLWNTFYHQPTNGGYEELERTVVKTDAIATLHWDLDGLGSNPRLVAIRRAQLIIECGKVPLVSLWHCSNHCENLITFRTVGAVNEKTHQWFPFRAV